MISGCPEVTVREYAKVDDVDRILEDFFAELR
jgi:hypothetical protein